MRWEARTSIWSQVKRAVKFRASILRKPMCFQAVHSAIERGLIRACHDLSEGGFAVAIAEMAFAGGVARILPISISSGQRLNPTW